MTSPRHMNDLLTALKETAAFVIANRDAFYEGCSDGEGHVPYAEDQECLAKMDKIIGRAQAVITEAEA